MLELILFVVLSIIFFRVFLLSLVLWWGLNILTSYGILCFIPLPAVFLILLSFIFLLKLVQTKENKLSVFNIIKE